MVDLVVVTALGTVKVQRKVLCYILFTLPWQMSFSHTNPSTTDIGSNSFPASSNRNCIGDEESVVVCTIYITLANMLHPH